MSLKQQTRWNFFQGCKTFKDWANEVHNISGPVPMGSPLRGELYKSLEQIQNERWKAQFEEEFRTSAEREIKDLGEQGVGEVFERFVDDLSNKARVLALDHDVQVFALVTTSRASDSLNAVCGSNLGIAFAQQKLGGQLNASQIFEEYVKGTAYAQKEEVQELESFIKNFNPSSYLGSVDMRRRVVPILLARQFRKGIVEAAQRFNVEVASHGLPPLHYNLETLEELGFEVVVDPKIEAELKSLDLGPAYAKVTDLTLQHYKLLIPALRNGGGVHFRCLENDELTPELRLFLETGGAAKSKSTGTTKKPSSKLGQKRRRQGNNAPNKSTILI
ncbi:hypothetical protein JCM5350_005039 [Sporobolomyces pararoseus]